MAKIKSVKSGSTVPIHEVVGDCLRISLQKHVDKLVENVMDPRMTTLLEGYVRDLLAGIDLAKVPVPSSEETEPVFPKSENPTASSDPKPIPVSEENAAAPLTEGEAKEPPAWVREYLSPCITPLPTPASIPTPEDIIKEII